MIKRLPDEIVRKIAAGEVVVGAYSVVKELVENSLDAGAHTIEIEIKNGGKSYIKVADDGEGMTEDEALLAIEPHTTSKISSINDLYNISTYGFRGEALSSIVKISRTTIITKKEENKGVKIEVEAGVVKSIENIEAKTGTSVIVRDLFFNIPARRKFLKSAAIEGRMVTEQVQKFLLSCQNVAFKYIKDGNVVYNTPTSDLRTRIGIVMPDSRPRELLKVDLSYGEIRIHGFISPPHIYRRNRTGQFFFVNKRYVLSNELFYSLEIGYGEALEKGHHPVAVLFLDVPQKFVDVNVHPQKIEVKFSNRDMVKKTIIKAVMETLKENVERIMPVRNYILKDKRKREEIYKGVEKEKYGVFKEPMLVETDKSYVTQKVENVKYSAEKVQEKAKIPNFLMIIKDRYILAENEEGLLIIDYHASHERILYEKMKEEYEKKGLDGVKLLFPLEVQLDSVLMDVLKANSNFLKKLGFDWEVSNNGVKITSIPQVLKIDVAAETFKEAVDDLRLSKFKGMPDTVQKILSDIACKSAVRTGDMITKDDAESIIREIYRRKLLSCPHGRPLIFRIDYKE
ncbi:MAG: DNA mismatch repair endonuclease MutL, partial [Thermotogaceae bacterium]|nr:DNA mismatch repair endonuclease MutL [Thermotogaceae bacterium]